MVGGLGVRLYYKTQTSMYVCLSEAPTLTQYLLSVCARLYMPLVMGLYLCVSLSFPALWYYEWHLPPRDAEVMGEA